MNEAERKSNVLGLAVLFVALTLIGVVLSYFYIFFQANAHDIIMNIVANFAVGILLAIFVWVIKRLMRITNDVLSLIVVIISLAITIYVMWNMWVVLMIEMTLRNNAVDAIADLGYMITSTRAMLGDSSYFIERLRFFNEHGTWSIVGNQWYGVMLLAVWAGEMLVITVFPIMAAYASVGLFLVELGAWVKEKLMNYGFAAFDDYELDKLASGDIDVILQKPLEAQGGPVNAIAVCYHKGEPTEFIAVYKAGWDKDGALSKGRHIMTVKLGIDKIDALDAGLQAIHYPLAIEKNAKDKDDTTGTTDAGTALPADETPIARVAPVKDEVPGPTAPNVNAADE